MTAQLLKAAVSRYERQARCKTGTGQRELSALSSRLAPVNFRNFSPYKKDRDR